MRIVEIFLPADEEQRERLGILSPQESGPRQTGDFNNEQLVDRAYVQGHHFGEGLAGGVALVVSSRKAETGRPDIAFGIFTSGNAVVIGVSEFEFFFAL